MEDKYMGHLEEKHTAKQKAELAERMMFERQIQVCSSFYKNMKEELENFVKTQSFDFSEREGVLHYVSKQPVGMCMNKSYMRQNCIDGETRIRKMIQQYSLLCNLCMEYKKTKKMKKSWMNQCMC